MIKKEFKTDFISPIVICDIEISNEIKDKEGNWNYENSDIVTLGILYGNKITIYQREKKDKLGNWKQAIHEKLKTMPVMFSLNTKMEKYSLKGFLGLNLFIEEIQFAKGRGCSKDNMFNDLIKNKIINKKDIPIDPFKGDSKLVIESYEKEDYSSIIAHNKSCLIKEYFIFINRFWFLKKYEIYINSNGWWDAETPFGVEPIIEKGGDEDYEQNFTNQ